MRRKLFAAIAAVTVAVEAVVLVRRRGYVWGLHTVVRCRSGHLFTTLWIPGASIKSVRLGWWRVQRCPVGRHWSVVTPVRTSDLTDDERRHAAEYRDSPVP